MSQEVGWDEYRRDRQVDDIAVQSKKAIPRHCAERTKPWI